MNNKYLVVIAGPTAVGKTTLGIELARFLNTEIISADSRQLYKELTVGTAKPTKPELSQVTHHFIDHGAITQDYNAGQFEKEVLTLLSQQFTQKDVMLMVGGSGLYIKGVTEGFDDFPPINPEIRKSLDQEFADEGLEPLQLRLKELDPDYYRAVDLNNPQRIIRALEISIGTGKPFSSFTLNSAKERPFQTIAIGINMEREALYQRINQRVDEMMEAGLLDEVKELTAFKNHNALQTVGYQELFDHLDGILTLDEAVELIKRNSRRYAKRQLTWFKKMPGIKWFEPNQVEVIKHYLCEQMPGVC